MRLLHIQAQLPSLTGSGIYFSNVIKRLAPHHQQAAIYGSFPGYDWDVLPVDKQYPAVFPNHTAPFAMPGMSDVMPYETTVYSEMTPEMIGQWADTFRTIIKQAVETFKPDVLLCHHLWLLTDLVRECYPTLPLLVFCHGTDLRQAKRHPQLARTYTKHLAAVDHVFMLSAEQITDIEATFGISRQKMRVLGAGYDDAIFHLPEAKLAPVGPAKILYAGKIAAAKGVFELLDAFISKRDLPAELHCYGNGDAASLARFKARIQTDSRIYYHGPVAQTHLAEAMRAGQVFILPSYYEGLPLVIVEAMACGLYTIVPPFLSLQAHLSDRLNQSPLIEYVAHPRIENADEPRIEDLPAYRERLGQAMQLQVKRALAQPALAQRYYTDIAASSWQGVSARIEAVIKQYA